MTVFAGTLSQPDFWVKVSHCTNTKVDWLFNYLKEPRTLRIERYAMKPTLGLGFESRRMVAKVCGYLRGEVGKLALVNDL